MMDALISGFVEDIKKRTVTVKPAGDETDRPVPVYDTTTDSDGWFLPTLCVTLSLVYLLSV